MSDHPPGLWLLAMAIGILSWFHPAFRAMGLAVLWSTLGLAFVCGAFAAFLSRRGRLPLALACGILFVVCYAIPVLAIMDPFARVRGDVRGAPDVILSLVAGLGFILLPYIATVGTVVRESGSPGVIVSVRLLVLTIVLAPISGTLMLLLVAMIFPDRL